MRSQIESLSIQRKPRSISTFLKKTYELLNDQQNHNIVRWGPNGIGFVVLNQDTFSKEILPKYFKHKNYSSFVRQLNMYNFHKIRENNSLNFFHHECFDKLNENKLGEIKRKPQKKKKKNQESEEEVQSDNENKQAGKSNQPNIKSNTNINEIPYTFNNDPFLMKNDEQKYTRHHVSSLNNGSGSSWRHLEQEEIQDDKISINDDISERFLPRLATRELFSPSSNNLFPFRVGHGQTSTFCIFY